MGEAHGVAEGRGVAQAPKAVEEGLAHGPREEAQVMWETRRQRARQHHVSVHRIYLQKKR